ncbi:hypothetical protein PR048_015636 [Dryococelus australis]|uniref:Uncharacterized protein n=1 Tax=Dryococelus australis TaxID=614101 RepID=A0ABQ9HHG1_9NEOP|nr:hypothetical protein PR048_015636 [Dryococelus australis]
MLVSGRYMNHLGGSFLGGKNAQACNHYSKSIIWWVICNQFSRKFIGFSHRRFIWTVSTIKTWRDLHILHDGHLFVISEYILNRPGQCKDCLNQIGIIHQGRRKAHDAYGKKVLEPAELFQAPQPFVAPKTTPSKHTCIVWAIYSIFCNAAEQEWRDNVLLSEYVLNQTIHEATNLSPWEFLAGQHSVVFDLDNLPEIPGISSEAEAHGEDLRKEIKVIVYIGHSRRLHLAADRRVKRAKKCKIYGLRPNQLVLLWTGDVSWHWDYITGNTATNHLVGRFNLTALCVYHSSDEKSLAQWCGGTHFSINVRAAAMPCGPETPAMTACASVTGECAPLVRARTRHELSRACSENVRGSANYLHCQAGFALVFLQEGLAASLSSLCSVLTLKYLQPGARNFLKVYFESTPLTLELSRWIIPLPPARRRRSPNRPNDCSATRAHGNPQSCSCNLTSIFVSFPSDVFVRLPLSTAPLCQGVVRMRRGQRSAHEPPLTVGRGPPCHVYYWPASVVTHAPPTDPPPPGQTPPSSSVIAGKQTDHGSVHVCCRGTCTGDARPVLNWTAARRECRPVPETRHVFLNYRIALRRLLRTSGHANPLVLPIQRLGRDRSVAERQDSGPASVHDAELTSHIHPVHKPTTLRSEAWTGAIIAGQYSHSLFFIGINRSAYTEQLRLGMSERYAWDKRSKEGRDLRAGLAVLSAIPQTSSVTAGSLICKAMENEGCLQRYGKVTPTFRPVCRSTKSTTSTQPSCSNTHKIGSGKGRVLQWIYHAKHQQVWFSLDYSAVDLVLKLGKRVPPPHKNS